MTGADGFIGSHTVELLTRAGARVRAFVRHNSRNDYGRLEMVEAAVLADVEVFTGDPVNPEIAQAYDEAIEAASPPSVHHLYVVRSPVRDVLRACETRGPLDVGRPAAAEVVSIPCYLHLTDGEVERVAAALATAPREGLIWTNARA